MKLSVPRLAARRAFGDPFHASKQINQTSLSLSVVQSQTPSARPLRRHSHLQFSRQSSSNAASKAQDAQVTPKNESSESPAPNTQSKASPASSISEHVRLLMRQVPYPVAIITSTDPTGPQDTSSFRGMTVSSFNTVTLTPHPVISFNVRRPSETLNALLASRRFLVHLLAPGSATATLARDFSKGNTTLASILSGHGDFQFGTLDVSAAADAVRAQDSDTSVAADERPLPILRRRNTSEENSQADFPFILECILHPSKVDVHDHSIILGTVVRAIEGSNADEKYTDGLCLTYANTKFWKMGKDI
ncbi:hypothetical protein N7478_006539 [Penicillium angulare]|uniref:uncharacterized protein n=1 Tax=Penicillium angulare TaxID=116970 RepID=UPI002540B55D|nr:uncharacterized protein N7478_006539 [Penicillium angulare]KAJ5281167.1 hypothetical protein N7478_006539 [Penicillium angulare]